MSDEQAQDGELLRRAAGGSRAAVAEIARRYVGFVYAAARRQVRDAHLAEDVTQAVFVILAQKVRRINPGAPLPAWLFTTTRYAAANATKLRNRREFHERKAAAMRNTVREGDPLPAALEGMLDEALADLRASDRTAILLSYMAGKSWREVADALGTTEEAARKRVTRAVAQLRGFFARRGVVTTGAALVAVITSSAEASVPPALLGTVTAAVSVGTSAGAGAGAAASGAASSLIAKGAVHMMTWAHVKLAAAGAVVFLGTLGGAGAMVMHQQADPRPAPTQAAARGPERVPFEIKHGPFTATLEGGIAVELLAVSKRGGNDRTWWAADGTPTGHKFNDSTSQDDPPHSHQAVVHVSGAGAAGASTTFAFPGPPNWSAQPATEGNAAIEGMQIVTFRAKPGAETIDFTVKVAAGEWETLSSKVDPDGVAINVVDSGAGIAWGQTVDDNGRTAITVSDTLKSVERRFVAVDQNGNEHEPAERSMGAGGGLNLSALKFDVPLDQVAEIRFQARSFDQDVVFRNVSLVPGKKTEPKVEIVKADGK